jgi:hypothetical protein
MYFLRKYVGTAKAALGRWRALAEKISMPRMS